jgi:hypothetical protein
MRTVILPRCLQMGWWQRVLTAGALFVTYVAPVHSQTISGQVVDSTTSEPIEGSDVFLFGAQGDTVGKSGSAGRFVFAARAGSYTLRVRCLGHRPKEVAVELAADTAVTIRLARLPAPGQSKSVVSASRGSGQTARLGWRRCCEFCCEFRTTFELSNGSQIRH